MGRRKDIKEQLQKDYEILKNLEDRLRTEIDSRLKLRWTEDINKVKQQIHQHEKELKFLTDSSVSNQNASDSRNSDKEKESSRVNMTFNAPVHGVAGNVQGNRNVYALEQKQSLVVEIILEIPEDATPEKIQEIIKQAATRTDMTHRSYGGNGLTIDTVEILAEDKVLEPSGK